MTSYGSNRLAAERNENMRAEARTRLRARFWAETALAALSGFLAVLTLAWRDWIEAILSVDPDAHNGSVEWLVVAGLAGAALLLAAAALSERRRPVYGT
jgi:hypothetical protein